LHDLGLFGTISPWSKREPKRGGRKGRGERRAKNGTGCADFSGPSKRSSLEVKIDPAASQSQGEERGGRGGERQAAHVSFLASPPTSWLIDGRSRQRRRRGEKGERKKGEVVPSEIVSAKSRIGRRAPVRRSLVGRARQKPKGKGRKKKEKERKTSPGRPFTASRTAGRGGEKKIKKGTKKHASTVTVPPL